MEEYHLLVCFVCYSARGQCMHDMPREGMPIPSERWDDVARPPYRLIAGGYIDAGHTGNPCDVSTRFRRTLFVVLSEPDHHAQTSPS